MSQTKVLQYSVPETNTLLKKVKEEIYSKGEVDQLIKNTGGGGNVELSPTIDEHSTDSTAATSKAVYDLGKTKANENHTHSGYSPSDHSHTGYADSSHKHSYNDLDNKPDIPNAVEIDPTLNAETATNDKAAGALATAGAIAQIQQDVNDLKNKIPIVDENLYYGVQIDENIASPVLFRIGNLQLHRTLPIQSKMRRCLLKDDGTVNYYLDTNDRSEERRVGKEC